MSESQLEIFETTCGARFGYLEKLNVTNHVFEAGEYCLGIEIQMRDGTDQESGALWLLFENVTELRLGNLNGLMFFSIGISDVSSWQRERTRFKVVESEHSAFSFYCYNFEFKVA